MSKVIRFIGDVHGKFRQYKRIIEDSPPSIQVGDMGIGFLRWPYGDPTENPPHYAMAPNHRFIRGNHDNPNECRKNSQWIKDGAIEGDMMLIGGAVSIDRAWRHEGFSWWADEELPMENLDALVDAYCHRKPSIMITHDCPESVAEVLVDCDRASMNRKAYPIKLDPAHASRSRIAFQRMLSAHPPKLWIFGHWHVPFDHIIKGTRFICLGELEYKDIDIAGLA